MSGYSSYSGVGTNMSYYDAMQMPINRYMQQQGFNNYGQQQNMNYQQPTNNARTSNADFVPVSGKENARNQIVPQGTTMWMLDNVEPNLYVKSVSNVGGIDFKAFKLVDITDDIPKQEVVNTEVGYVTIEQFNKIQEEMNTLTAKIAMYESLLQGNTNTKETKTTTRRGGTANESTK